MASRKAAPIPVRKPSVRPATSRVASRTARPATEDKPNNASRIESSSIQVAVRCRGNEVLDDCVVRTNGTRSSELVISTNNALSSPSIPAASANPLGPSLSSVKSSSAPANPAEKIYPFDHVFSPEADQALVYEKVVSPLLDEVLLGYNCTLFTYGATGSGKTFTTEGDLTPVLGGFSSKAGVIPRTLYRLFHLLEERQTIEFSVRVSFVELYNEELRDLNAATSLDVEQMLQPELKIFDDSAKKGVIIQGVEETMINSAAEGIKVLTRGSQRRQIAATNCNDRSSRSHSVFSITVHMKESSANSSSNGPSSNKASEDLLKVGKMNLVDLAGSENVGRSGAKESRAREAGMINQSLLTLGRVINALVEKSTHIPYRESKLTRLLQDSLGGRTKTCIIATISSSRANLEETISTLDYALRAKSIQNRPEANAKITRNALLNQYATEIERLKADLLAAREKNGIYLSQESWSDMDSEHSSRRIQLDETKRQADLLDMQLRTMSEQFEHSLRLLTTKDGEIKGLSEDLEGNLSQVKLLKGELDDWRGKLDKETALRKRHEAGRKEWKLTAGQAIQDTEGLREKIARKKAVEAQNSTTIAQARRTIGTTTSVLSSDLKGLAETQQTFASTLAKSVEADAIEHAKLVRTNQSILEAQEVQLAEELEATSVSSSGALNLASTFVQAVEQAVGSMQAAITSHTSQSKLATDASAEKILHICQEMMFTTTKAFEELVSISKTSSQANAATLSSNASLMRKRQEAETLAQAEENKRLKAQNAMLQQIVDSQQAELDHFEETLLASVSSQLSKFKKSRTSTLAAQVEAMHSGLATSHTASKAAYKSRSSDLSALLAQEEQIATSISSCAEQLAGLAGTQALGMTKIQSNMQRQVQRSVQEQTMIAEPLVSESARVTEAITVQAKHFDCTNKKNHKLQEESSRSMIARAQDACQQLRDGLDDISNASEAASVAVLEAVSDFQDSSSTAMIALDQKLNVLSTKSEDYLSTKLQADLETGQTPRKRDWPDHAADTSLDLEPETFEATIPHHVAQTPLINVPVAKQRMTTHNFKVLSDKNNIASVMSAVASVSKPESSSRTSIKR